MPFVLLTGLCLTAALPPAPFEPFAGPKPIAVYIDSDPWNMVIGSDTPRVALYENGDVIFVRKAGEYLKYFHAVVDKDRLAKLREKLKPVLDLKSLKLRYNMLPSTDDVPTAMFYLRDGKREIATSVYGLVAEPNEDNAKALAHDRAEATIPPAELLTLHKWLCNFDEAKSDEWTPKYVEVMVSDYSHAPDLSIRWPKEWPSLKSERTIKRGDAFSIFMDGARLADIRKFLATRKEKGAVEIDGRKMGASYRFTFPNEPMWRKAFEEHSTEEIQEGGAKKGS